MLLSTKIQFTSSTIFSTERARNKQFMSLFYSELYTYVGLKTIERPVKLYFTIPNMVFNNVVAVVRNTNFFHKVAYYSLITNLLQLAPSSHSNVFYRVALEW